MRGPKWRGLELFEKLTLKYKDLLVLPPLPFRMCQWLRASTLTCITSCAHGAYNGPEEMIRASPLDAYTGGYNAMTPLSQ